MTEPLVSALAPTTMPWLPPEIEPLLVMPPEKADSVTVALLKLDPPTNTPSVAAEIVPVL